jgi:prevent-host-death family protein
VVRLCNFRITTRGRKRTLYLAGEIDGVAAYCGDLDRVYFLPAELVVGRSQLHLRVGPPRNGQRAALHWATEYELHGAVAQLEERVSGRHEATGSSPVSSTPTPVTTQIRRLGAHEFRNHFGYYMERAAAGDEIHISRHGRPFARLMPPASLMEQAAESKHRAHPGAVLPLSTTDP